MAQERPYKRTQYLVDASYQVQFAIRIFWILLIVAAVSFMASAGLLWNTTHRPELAARVPFISTLLTIATTLLVELVIAIPLVAILSIRQSHRVVGPFTRVKRAIAAIGRGDFSQRITLRDGDTLSEIATVINEMAEQLQRRHPPSARP